MTSVPSDVRRSGFTLVELLVAMAVAVTLAAIALAVVPDAMEQDRTTDGAATVRAQLMIAKARALRDNAPRGVRFLIGADPNNPTKNSLWSTEVQHIEQPPPVLVNPNGSTVPSGTTYAPPPGFFPDSYLEFRYTIPSSGVQMGQITERHAYLVIPNPNLATGVIGQIQNDVTNGLTPRLYVAGMGNLYIGSIPAPTGKANEWEITFKPSPWTDVDSVMGGGQQKRYFAFALYLSPRPLLGEPTIPLPKNICVDLTSSNLPTTGNCDILFAPNGQVIYPSDKGQIYLWVRDYTKPGGAASTTFDQGGEQQIVGLKTKSGSLGVYPVAFPPDSPYLFARDAR